MIQRATIAAIVTAIATARGATGQANDAIPRSTVMAILRNIDGPGEPTISTSPNLPDDLAGKFSLPPGTRIVATLGGASTRIIGTAPGHPDSIRVWFNDEFERRGFEPWGFGSVGPAAFIPAQRPVGTVAYCSQGRMFTPSVRALGAGQVEFVLRIEAAACSRNPGAGGAMFGRGRASGYNPPELPRLMNPRAAGFSIPCSTASNQGGESSRETQVGIASEMMPSALLDHYGRQLDSAGWKREMITSGAAGSWTRRDSTGRNVRLVLTALPGLGGSDCRDLSMSLRVLP